MRGISLMAILPLLFLAISLNIANFHYNIGKIYEKYDLLTQKRWVEDYLSAITLKVKNFFPIGLENNRLIYEYRDFTLGHVVNKTNTILVNYSGGWFYFDFSDDFSTIYYNLTSSYYIFRFNEPFVVIYLPAGKKKFRATYYFYYDGVLVYNRNVNRGTFIVKFFDGTSMAIYHSYLAISNPYRKEFIMEFDKELDLKTLLWWIEIKRGRFHYGGYIRWR